MILHIQGIPEELQKAFKLACMKKGSTMKDEIIKYMEKVVDNAQKVKK